MIATTSTLAPHLTNRGEIYLFPNVKDAQFVVLRINDDIYPLQKPEDFRNEISKLVDGGKFEVYRENEHIIILRRERKNNGASAYTFEERD